MYDATPWTQSSRWACSGEEAGTTATALTSTRKAGEASPASCATVISGGFRAPQLEPDGSVVVGEVTATAALSSLARDAIDLFRGPLGHRIRVCAADDCGFLFVDASRPGQRRWCSMQGCDNLAKVRRHRAGAPKETS